MTGESAPKKPRGRRVGSGAGYTAKIPVQRVTPLQRAAWDRLGPNWLRPQLDAEARRLGITAVSATKGEDDGNDMER